MSYCVHCGVELDDSAKRCALCQTPVIDPNKLGVPKQEAPFSDVPHEITDGQKKRFVSYVISMAILIPNIVCVLTNLMFFPASRWSAYIGLTSFLAWVFFVTPFFTKKPRPYGIWLFDTASAAVYVCFLYLLGNLRHAQAYFLCALPIVLLISLFILMMIYWLRKKKRHWIAKSIFIVSAIGLLSILSGAIIKAACSVDLFFETGVIIFVCCAALVGFAAYCYSSKAMRRWLSKRFFV